LNRIIKEQQNYLLALTVLLGIAVLLLFNLNKGDELKFFSQNRNQIGNTFFTLSNYLGEAYLYVIVSLIFFFRKNWVKGILVVLTGFTAMLLSQFLKNYFGHERPLIYFKETLKQPDLLTPVPGIELVNSYTSSFPSGHTTAAFALFGLLAFFTPKSTEKTIWLIPATMAGVSRIYLGQHFLEDVIAGAVLGSLIAIFLFAIHQSKFTTLFKINSK
jgi:membrane-associated phospholipid phosphatase